MKAVKYNNLIKAASYLQVNSPKVLQNIGERVLLHLHQKTYLHFCICDRNVWGVVSSLSAFLLVHVPKKDEVLSREISSALWISVRMSEMEVFL